VNRFLKLNPLLLSGALVAMAAEPGMASVTTINDVQLSQTNTGLEVIFDTNGGDASNVFTVSQGNTLRADMTRTQLALPNGDGFTETNPAPGIAEVSVMPLDANSVRVIITGTDQAPAATVASAGGQIMLSVNSNGATVQQPSEVPDTIETVADPTAEAMAQAAPDDSMVTPDSSDTIVPPTQETPDVLVPDPEITIDGNPVPQPQVQQAPPFLPRAVAPPVGDIAIAESGINISGIDLGSNERIPKLLLRDAPAREVLSLLARAAGLNLVFTSEGGEGGEGAGGDGPLVTLDIEDESVNDVFNHVLRITDLRANRVGRSIYVGPQLPLGARSVISRTLRLNQVSASDAAGYLASLGATATQITTQPEIEVVTTEGAVEGAAAVSRTIETQTTEVEEISFDPAEDSGVAVPLAGLQAVADSRLNSLTLVGEPELVELATEYLTRLDLRRRQVAINVKVIDLNLASTENFGVSFTYLNNGLSIGTAGGFTGTINTNTPTPFSQQLLVEINAAISDQNAKIITDPTLIIQEGQVSSVALVESVLTSIETEIDGDSGVRTQTPVFEDAGLILTVQVERIDDNGFVTFNVSPTISSPQPAIPFETEAGTQFLTPISRREVSSGSIRVRDGQTLLLAGIIQEGETASVTKVPILGDLPIIGALFRSSQTVGQRDEVIVMLTPEILDDSDQSTWGYSYTPSEEAEAILNQN
jgi:type IV pilus assembly protein PilQ